MAKTALVVGASGIVGSATTALLVERGWTVHGLARRPTAQAGVHPVAADLQDPGATAAALRDVNPDAVFITTWARQDSEAENIRVNAAMVRNLLDGLRGGTGPRHVALVTGLKHYLGPFEAYGKGTLPQTPFPRGTGSAGRREFLLCAGGRGVCRRRARRLYLERASPAYRDRAGGRQCHEHGYDAGGLCDLVPRDGATLHLPRFGRAVVRADRHDRRRQLARHLLWATETEAAHDEAFNVVNGDVFRWQWMWGRIANWFGVEAAPFDGIVRPLEQQMANDAALWREIATREGLVEPDLNRLASPWHTDADLGRPIEVVTDMSKSRRLGFTGYQPTDDAFFALFERLRDDRLIP